MKAYKDVYNEVHVINEDINSSGGLQRVIKVFEDSLKSHFQPVAVMVSRLPDMLRCIEDNHPPPVKTSNNAKDVYGYTVFMLHLIQVLKYCKDIQSGPVLEHFFVYLKYQFILFIIFLHFTSFATNADRTECQKVIGMMVQELQRLCPVTFYAAITEMIQHPLLKAVKHEYILKSLGCMELAVLFFTDVNHNIRL